MIPTGQDTPKFKEYLLHSPSCNPTPGNYTELLKYINSLQTAESDQKRLYQEFYKYEPVLPTPVHIHTKDWTHPGPCQLHDSKILKKHVEIEMDIILLKT